MDPLLLPSQRERLSGATAANPEHLPSSIGQETSHNSVSIDNQAEGLLPPRKKPKLAPPRPLRTVRPPGSNVAPLTSNGPSKIAPLVSSASKETGTSPTKAIATQNSNVTKASSLAATPSQSQVSYFSKDCSYCHKLIEGGEAGRRRHQNGQQHVFNVLRGLVKYVAPDILPFSQWRFPTPISSVNTTSGAMAAFLQEQGRLIELFAEHPLDAPIEELKASYRSIDVNLAFFLLITQPKAMKSATKALTWDILNRIRGLHGFLSFPSLLPKCPICGADEEYSTHTRPLTIASTEQEPSETSNISSAPHSQASQYLCDSIGSNLSESLFLEYLRHLASEEHRKSIDKFWRDHHVSHPSDPAMSNLTVSRTNHGQSLLKDSVLPPDDPRNAYLFKLNESHFGKDSYALDMAHLQKSIESWARLRHIVFNGSGSIVNGNDSASNFETTSSSLHPSQMALAPSNGLLPAAYPPFNPMAPFPAHPWGLFGIPPAYAPSVLAAPLSDADVPLKQRILKFALPYDAKKGERVGARWADAVKAFIAANPGMSTTQIIKLSRLERAGDPRRQPTWYPSFGGVWNESTRADHQRSFFKASSSQKDYKRH